EIVAGGYYTATYQSNTGTAVLVGQGSGAEQVNPATQSKHAVQLGQVGHGQCRLSVASTTQLVLKPYNGSNVIVNGAPFSIPSAGITYTASGLTASTAYYVYLSVSAGVGTLVLNSLAHSPNPANGVETATSNTALTLVGMVYNGTSGFTVSAPGNQLCLNWFQRRRLPLATASSSNNTTSGSSVALGGVLNCLSWADGSINAVAFGAGYNTTINCGGTCQLFTNGAAGAATAGQFYSTTSSGSGIQYNFSSTTTQGSPTELTLYAFQLFGAATTGGSAFFGWSTQGGVDG
ncbi:MAG: hypothetical protein WCA85_26150, partial [Paraburkholderia sp.]|uniref:hypothetical protein n=1 Tax=Paraburkholderia sp. TaxID=1926495 RepID=UPI003C650BC3